MSGHERCEQFDTKAINNSFLSSKSRLNLIGFLYEFGASKVVTRVTKYKSYAFLGYFQYGGYFPTNDVILACCDTFFCFESNTSIKPKENIFHAQ